MDNISRCCCLFGFISHCRPDNYSISKSSYEGSRIAAQWINWTTFLANLDSSGVERWQLLGPSGHKYSFSGVALDDQGRRRYSRVISLGIIP